MLKFDFSKSIDLVNNISEELIDKINSQRKLTREKAISLILINLKNDNPEDLITAQWIPLVIAQNWDIETSISFLSTIISNWYYVDFDIFKEILEISFWDIEESKLSMNEEYSSFISKKLNNLLSLSSSVDYYYKNPEFLYYLWSQYLDKWKINKAKIIFEELIKLWDFRWYYLMWLYFRSIWDNDNAILNFEYSLKISNSFSTLNQIIIILCENWDYEKAKKYYDVLVKFFSSNYDVLPFIMYSFNIEWEEDLFIIEQIFSKYLLWNDLIPSNSLSKMSLVASLYIDDKLEKINEKLLEFKQKWISTLDPFEFKVYDEYIKMRLYLMQFDITILKNQKYLVNHLFDLETIAFSRNSDKVSLLWDYFDEYPCSLYKNSWETESYDNNSENDKIKSHTVFDKLSNYLSFLLNIFFHWNNYDVCVKKIFPLLKKVSLETNYSYIYDIEDSSNLIVSLRNNISNLSPLVYNFYVEFLSEIDSKYGRYYRVNMQNLARLEITNEEKNQPKILSENSQISLFFLIEKFLSNNYLNISDKELSDILLNYDFSNLSEENSLLYIMILSDKSYDLTIETIINSPILVKNVFAIYFLLIWLINISDEKLRNEKLKKLNLHFKQHYDSKSFINYIRKFLYIQNKREDISNIELGYILLINSNVAILQNKSDETVLQNLYHAEDSFKSDEATIKIWEFLESKWDIDKSYIKYLEAYNSDNNLQNLSKIILVLIKKSDFTEAIKYINIWLRAWYNMDYYIFSYNIWVWNLKSAFQSFVKLLNAKDSILDQPEGTLNLLMKRCSEIDLLDWRIEVETLKLKAFSSYISCKMNNIFNYNNPYKNTYNHAINIFWILNSVPEQNIANFVGEVIYPICWYSEELWDEILDSMDDYEKSIVIIDFYAESLYKSLIELQENQKTYYFENYQKMNLNTFSFYFLKFFSQISWTKDYISKWQSRLTFTKYDWTNIMNENLYWSRYLN